MNFLGSITPNQDWQTIDFSVNYTELLIDFSPLIPDLQSIRSLVVLRRVFTIEGIQARDEHFETYAKKDNEIIIFKPISINTKLLISETKLEVCKVYKPTYYTYNEPNYVVLLYGLGL